MIKIYKNNDYKVVTNGVFKSIYEPLGYKPVVENKKVVKVQPKVEEPKVEEPKIEEPKVEEPVELEPKKESSRPKRKRGE